MVFTFGYTLLIFLNRKQKKELGSKLLIALNICDLTICALSAAVIPTFDVIRKEKTEIFNGFVMESDPQNRNEKNEMEKAAIVNDYKNYKVLNFIWYVGTYIPFQLLVMVSCVITVILSVTRMIAMIKPLFIIKQRLVWTCLTVISMFLVGTTMAKWASTQSLELLDEISYEKIENISQRYEFRTVNSWIIQTYIRLSEFTLVAAMVIIVAMCSAVTVKSLRSPIVAVIDPGGVKNDSQNRRATVMVLLLSLAFFLINASWIITFLNFYIGFLMYGPSSDTSHNRDRVYLNMNFITLTLMTANSFVNPLIYISRNSKLNEYTKTIARNAALKISWIAGCLLR